MKGNNQGEIPNRIKDKRMIMGLPTSLDVLR